MTFDVELQIERAVFGIQLGVADIFIAIQSAQTIDEARNIHRMTQQLTELLLVCESAALDRADALNV